MIRFLQSGNKAAKYLLSGFLLALCLGMVVYLIPGFMADTGVTQTGVVATVGDQDVRAQDVNKLVQAQMRAQHYPPQFASFLMSRAAQSLIQRAEVHYEATRMGLKVSDDEVRDELRNAPQYKQVLFPKGVWIGKKKYQELLENAGTTIEEFQNNVREDLLSRKLMNTVTASVNVSPSEIEQAYKDQNTKVKFQYAVLDSANLQKQIKPTEAELKAYYKANTARYQRAVPEKREVRYFVLSDRNAETKVTVDPSDLQKYYSDNQDAYRVPDRARVRHILIKTPTPGPDGKVDQKAVDAARAKAEDILKQIKAGGNFAELAKKYSQDPGSAQNGGELGWILKGQTVPEFEKTAFAQPPGQISGLVKTSYGFHIIQTEEKEPAHVKPLAEVKTAIEQAVRAQKTSALLTQQANEAQDLAVKQGIDKAAAKFGAQVIQSNPVARNEALPGVGQAQELMNEIFALTAKAGPQVGRTSQSYVVYQVTKIDPPRAPAFEEIRDKVATDFKTERASNLLRKQTQQLADRAHTLHDLAKAAKEVGASVKTSDLVGKTAQVPDIGPMAGPASAAFNLKPGEISGPLNLGQKGLVLALIERQEPSTTDEQFAKSRDHLQEQLADQKRQQVLQLFMDNLNTRLEKEGKVKINQSEMANLTKARG